MNTKITLVTSRLLYLLVFLIISHVAKAQADVWDGLTATEPAGWTAGDAAVNISSAAELAWVAQMVNEDRQTGNTASDKMFISCTLTLTTDIDLAGHEWTPIGIGLSNTDLYSIKKNCFRGTFDGQNHTISNLKIRGTHTFAGLFGIIGDASFPTPGNGGLVKNLHIENADIELTTPTGTGYSYVGALAGLKGGDVMDGCSATGKIVTGEKVYAGGLVGMNYGGYGTCSIITNCYASVDVTAGSGVVDTYTYKSYIGGFVGQNGTTSGGHPIIYNCYSTGNVKGGDYAYIGGFVGQSVFSSNDYEANDVHSCYSLGTVEGGSTDTKVGGFAGNAGTRSTLLNCYWNQDAYAKGTGNDAERTTENLLPVPADVSKNNFLVQWMNQGAYNYSTTKGTTQTSLLKKYAWELLPGSEHPTLTQTELTAAAASVGTTDADPYLIASPTALKTFANVVNAGNDFDGKFVKLTADVDLDSEEWTPIGNSDSNPFKGTFDGNGYQVQNLYINKISGESITSGLFGWLNSGTIQNLGVVISEKGVTMKVTNSGVGDSQLGGIVGLGQKATLKNCYVTGGAISGNAIGSASYLGGVVGSWKTESWFTATISNCYSTVDIYNGEETKGLHSVSGGIVGYMDNYDGNAGIANCFSSGIISAKDPSDTGGAGGILGYAVRYGSNSMSIKNSLALNYKLITKDGDVACFVGRILGESPDNGAVSFNFQDNHAYDNIVWDDLTNSTSNPITGSNAADKNGAGWDWRNNDPIPASILDNTSNWETGVLPVMPKLKTTTGVLMANQPDVSIPYPLEFAATTHGAVRAKYYKTYAGAGTQVELVITPDQNSLLGSLTYQPEGENAVAITENAGHYYFTMPGKKTTIAAVFNVKSDITIASVTNGAISIEGNKTEALDGDKITFTATPANGYKLSGLPTVTKAGGGNVTVNSEGNNKYSFDMPDDAVTIAATFSKENPDPQPPVTPDPEPTVYYTVALPSVEGATTDPVAGEYEVEAWGSFRFYLTLDKGYDQSEPIVTTDRGEAITPRSSDGAYIVKYVRQPVEIRIEGVVKNPDPVANETIAADGIGVWTADGCLYISVTTEVRAAVYNFNGRLLKQARILPGQTRWQFPSGAYIVEVDGKRYKVML